MKIVCLGKPKSLGETKKKISIETKIKECKKTKKTRKKAKFISKRFKKIHENQLNFEFKGSPLLKKEKERVKKPGQRIQPKKWNPKSFNRD